MIREGIFSDETEDYVFPAEPEAGERMRIRLRVAGKDAEIVELVDIESGKHHSMEKVSEKDDFVFYEAKLVMPEKFFRYYFEIHVAGQTLYYTEAGINEQLIIEGAFCIVAGFHTPEWAKGALMYQIFVDRFHRGDANNDVLDDEYIYLGIPTRHIVDWGEYPSTFDVGYFYGGDLQGVWDKLDYLQDLGVEVIYFNPLFVSPSNHKYDTQDYWHIDPHYGKIVEDGGELLEVDAQTNEHATKYMIRTANPKNLEASDALFAEFMQQIHKRGMRVIIDGVFNHCGSFNKWMDREKIYQKFAGYPPGAYTAQNSPYHNYFEFFDQKKTAWPDNKSYDGWWGNSTLPKLYYENSEKLVEEIMGVAVKWVSEPYCVDGWRLDVAADLGHSRELNHVFWRKFRQVVKEANPEAFILAEHYGDPSSWLDGRQWDSVMNYDAFMEPVSWFLTGMEKHSDQRKEELLGNGRVFFDMLNYAKAKMPMPAYMTAMNELSNHDHSRFLTRTNHVIGRLHQNGSRAAELGVDLSVLRQGVVMQMTLQGAPTIYYGDEAGVCGWTDPDNRRTYPWGKEDLGLIDFHRYINRIHTNSTALKRGSLIPLVAEKDLIAYARSYQREHVLVVIYTGELETEFEIPAWIGGFKRNQKVKRVILSDRFGYNVGALETEICDGILRVHCKAKSAMVYQ